MRLVSADSSSDLSLPASVIKNRLVVKAKCPMSSSVAGKTILIHIAMPDNRPNSTPSKATNNSEVNKAAMPADNRGKAAMTYAHTNNNTPRFTHQLQLG